MSYNYKRQSDDLKESLPRLLYIQKKDGDRINKLQELKIAAKHEHDVVLTLEDGNIILGLPTFGVDPKRVKVRTKEGFVWVPLNEIDYVTRIIPLKI